MTVIETEAIRLLTRPDDPADALTEAEARAAIKVAIEDGHGPYANGEELAECAREHWNLGDVEADGGESEDSE